MMHEDHRGHGGKPDILTVNCRRVTSPTACSGTTVLAQVKAGDNSNSPSGLNEYSIGGALNGQFNWGVDANGFLDSGWVTLRLCANSPNTSGTNALQLRVDSSAWLFHTATYTSINMLRFEAQAAT